MWHLTEISGKRVLKYWTMFIFGTMDFLKDLFNFLWERKLWWLTPIILLLLLIGALIIFGGGSSVAPFIYTLF
jgi:hypothetical protein